MTPNKRATLLCAFLALLGALLVWHGVVTGAQWVQVVIAALPH